MRTLRKDINGSDVGEVQGFLKDERSTVNNEPFYNGPIDNKFGPVLENSVILFQKENGLTPDGIIGAKTYEKFAELGFKKDGTELKEDKIDKYGVRAIIKANSHKLVAPINPYNATPTAFDPDKHVIAVAIRGYDLNEGTAGKNDRRIYDDAFFIVSPNEVKMFEGNTDPNGYRSGSGTGSNKGMACLKKGVWFFAKGPHKGSPAFRQACPFTVLRDGDPPYEHTGYHAINWHSGGVSSTSSLGCQTASPNVYVSMRDYIYKKLDECDNPLMANDWGTKARTIPYILIEEVDRRKGNLVV